MSGHDVMHEAELELLSATRGDPRAAFAGSRLASCATCCAQLDALLSARAKLASDSRRLRDALRAATAGVAGLEARTERQVAAAPAPSPHAADRVRRACSALALLAGLATLVAALWLLSTE